MSISSKERESGIELLRILSAVGVVYSHYCNAGGIFSGELELTSFVLLSFIRSLTISAVDVFVLITGFFLCKSNKRSAGKPIGLLIQVSFYSLLVYMALISCGIEVFSVHAFIGRLIPDNWFITLYIVLYLISPYINVVINRFTKKDWMIFLIIMLSLFSISPMLLGLTESMGIPLNGLSTIGRSGNAAGYSIVNFVTLYCIGAYIRLSGLAEKTPMKASLLTTIACVIILWLLRFVPINSSPWHISGWYDNIFVIIMSASLFITFKKLHLNNSVINTIAKAAFTVYIIHFPLFKIIDPVATLRLPIFLALFHIVAFIIGVYVISLILFSLYTRLSKYFIAQLDKYIIPYF